MGCWCGYLSAARRGMVQLMPLPLTVSCFSKIQIGFTFWYRLTRVVPDKGPLNGCVYVGTIIEQMDHKKYTRRPRGGITGSASNPAHNFKLQFATQPGVAKT